MIILLNIFLFLLFNVVASQDDCGSFPHAVQAVFNGAQAGPGEFPFLFPLVMNNSLSSPFCSGNIISKNIALTGKTAIKYF